MRVAKQVTNQPTPVSQKFFVARLFHSLARVLLPIPCNVFLPWSSTAHRRLASTGRAPPFLSAPLVAQNPQIVCSPTWPPWSVWWAGGRGFLLREARCEVSAGELEIEPTWGPQGVVALLCGGGGLRDLRDWGEVPPGIPLQRFNFQLYTVIEPENSIFRSYKNDSVSGQSLNLSLILFLLQKWFCFSSI
jgi:hypothetical protein